MKVVFDENVFDEIDHFHPNFDESVPNQGEGASCRAASGRLMGAPCVATKQFPPRLFHTICGLSSCPTQSWRVTVFINIVSGARAMGARCEQVLPESLRMHARRRCPAHVSLMAPKYALAKSNGPSKSP